MSYSSTVLADNPIRYYRLGESSGTVAVDIGSQAQNGTQNGGITLGQTGLLVGDVNTAELFNGSSGYISLPTTGLPTGASAVSLECWIKMTTSLAGAGYNSILSLGTRTTNNEFNLFTDPVNLGIDAEISGIASITGPALTLNVPHHFVVTYDGSTLTLYQDGVSVGTPFSWTAAITFGGAFIGAITDLSGYFPGTIDEVAIYSTALTSTQVAAHHAAGISLSTQPKNVLRALVGRIVNRATEMRAFGATLIKRYQPPINQTAYSTVILANHPIAYYRMNETSGTVAYDASGNSYHAQLTGVTAQSRPGSVGDGDFSTLLTAVGGILLPPTLHIEVWPSFGLEFWIQIEGMWEYVGVDWDGATTTVYRNGVPYTPSAGASVGIEQGFSWMGAGMVGKLDEIALYPRLTSTMAAADYAAGSANVGTRFIPRALAGTLVQTLGDRRTSLRTLVRTQRTSTVSSVRTPVRTTVTRSLGLRIVSGTQKTASSVLRAIVKGRTFISGLRTPVRALHGLSVPLRLLARTSKTVSAPLRTLTRSQVSKQAPLRTNIASRGTRSTTLRAVVRGVTRVTNLRALIKTGVTRSSVLRAQVRSQITRIAMLRVLARTLHSVSTSLRTRVQGQVSKSSVLRVPTRTLRTLSSVLRVIVTTMGTRVTKPAVVRLVARTLHNLSVVGVRTLVRSKNTRSVTLRTIVRGMTRVGSLRIVARGRSPLVGTRIVSRTVRVLSSQVRAQVRSQVGKVLSLRTRVATLSSRVSVLHLVLRGRTSVARVRILSRSRKTQGATLRLSTRTVRIFYAFLLVPVRSTHTPSASVRVIVYVLPPIPNATLVVRQGTADMMMRSGQATLYVRSGETTVKVREQ